MDKNNLWIRVGSIDDFPVGKKIPITVESEDILVYRDEKRWYAFERKCPHQSKNLDDAVIEGTVLSCNFHALKLDIATGGIIFDAGFIGLPDLKVFPVKIENGEVFIKPLSHTVDSWDDGLTW